MITRAAAVTEKKEITQGNNGCVASHRYCVTIYERVVANGETTSSFGVFTLLIAPAHALYSDHSRANPTLAWQASVSKDLDKCKPELDRRRRSHATGKFLVELPDSVGVACSVGVT